MLLLPHSIILNELEPITDFFPISAILKTAKKVQNSLGFSLAGAPPDSKLIKIYLTGKQTAGRAVFLIQFSSENMFFSTFNENYTLISQVLNSQ